MKIKEYKIGNTYKDIFMITDISEKRTKTNNTYLNLEICDGEQKIVAKLWNQSVGTFNFEKASLIKLVLNVSEYNDAKSYTISEYHDVSKTDNVSVQDFIKSAPMNGEFMYNGLLKLANSFNNEDLKNLINCIYSDYKEKLLYWSAAKSVHHNCYSGLLWHVYRMVISAQKIARVYPKTLDMELLVTGVMLHDIGKLEELTTDDFGNATYSIKGNLLGHAVLGILIIERYCTKLNVNSELKLLLQHILAAHHKLIEWGAVKNPALAEAAIVSYVDQIDADMYKYEENFDMLEEGEMSDRIYSNGNVIYKPNRYISDND